MYMLTILATEMVENVIENQNVNTEGDLIGIGGIIATIVVGIITCFVTWKVAMKTIQQLKIAYSYQIFPILSKSVNAMNLIDLQIKYRDKLLPKACLLTVDIINNGNKAIIAPPIKIKFDENIEIIPGYFEDVPPGYVDLWSMKKEDTNSCSISLNHINPKQIVKARFFLNTFPETELSFECPLPDVQIQKISSINEAKADKRQIALQKSNIIVLIVTVVMFLSIEYWNYHIDLFIYHNNLQNYLISSQVVLYIMTLLVLINVFNISGIKKIDNYLLSHTDYVTGIKIAIPVICVILLFLIISNIITSLFAQYCIAAITAVLIAFWVHIIILQRDNDF